MNIDWSKAPEGATHWDPVDRNHLRQLGEITQCWIEAEQSWTCKGWQYPDDLSTMPRLIKRPAWNGEGLPPVGTVCEYKPSQLAGEWKEVEVIAHFMSKIMVAAFIPTGDGIKTVSQAIARCFRPLRTAEQIAAEEREKAVHEILSHMRGVDRDKVEMAMSIYDAGYRKQVQP